MAGQEAWPHLSFSVGVEGGEGQERKATQYVSHAKRTLGEEAEQGERDAWELPRVHWTGFGSLDVVTENILQRTRNCSSREKQASLWAFSRREKAFSGQERCSNRAD